ncbi:MAG: hypothetical protein II008_18420 [Oscillospiraceae bacterium]|nr:hypothetical protein [Oscillospiraceae bacterium]
MAFVKCRYVEMRCLNKLCPFPENEFINDDPARFVCEWQDEEGDLATCRFAKPVEHYIEGEYKRVKWDGTLKVANKMIASRRNTTCYLEEFNEGIHYLEIDGHVYITDDETEETEAGL